MSLYTILRALYTQGFNDGRESSNNHLGITNDEFDWAIKELPLEEKA